MWIEEKELDLLDIIFEDEKLVPKNRKGNLKLRHLSFFMSNTKAITNICKNLDKFIKQSELQHQYVEVLKKMGLVNKFNEITKYGLMLLKILYFDNNRILNELSKENVNIEGVSEDIPYIIEFFLFSVVTKCLINSDECERCGIDPKDLAYEPMNNLEYFFLNIIDTLNEPTNTNKDFKDIFMFDNADFYYAIQGINFSGIEVKRLFRLDKDRIKEAVRIYLKILESSKNIKADDITNRELKYYNYAKYYNNLVQKDVRNRVVHSIINYIIINSLNPHSRKIKIVKNPKFCSIIPYQFIEEVFTKYNFIDIYNLVYFEKDSKYITNDIKFMFLNIEDIKEVNFEEMLLLVNDINYDKGINIGDSLFLVEKSTKSLLKKNIYDVVGLRNNKTSIEIKLLKREEININKEELIIKKIEGSHE